MVMKLYFKHMESSKAIGDYAEKRLSPVIRKFSPFPLEAATTFLTEGLDQKVLVSMMTRDGHRIRVEQKASTLFEAIDRASDRLERQLRRHKEILRAQRIKGYRRGGFKGTEAYLREIWDTSEFRDMPVDAQDILEFERIRAEHPRQAV